MHEIIDLDTIAGVWPLRAADISVGRLLSLMDQHRVARSCVVSARGILYDDSDGNAETLRWCAAEPRLIPVGTVDLRRYVGYRDIIARMTAAGVRLWRLFPEQQGWTYDMAGFRRVLSALEDVGAVLFLMGQASAVARATAGARLPIILGHHYSQMGDLLAVLEGGAGSPGAGFYVSTRHLHSMGALEVMAETVGAERLIFGSGAPLSALGSALNRVLTSRLTAEQQAAVLGGNLRRLLGESSHV